MSNEIETIKIAKVCHEINYAYCRAIDDPCSYWCHLNDELRQSICDGVRNAMTGVTPKESHDHWFESRFKDGWRYGERDDRDKKHPNMVTYEELPESQKSKDKIFLAVVEGLKDRGL